MKTIYCSVFLISLTLSAASNNHSPRTPHFTRLKELHALGVPLRYKDLDIYPGKGLALLATLATLRKNTQEELKAQVRLKKSDQQNQELRLKLKDAKDTNERLLTTIQELRAKNDHLSSSLSNDQFSTPPSSPTGVINASKSLSKNNLITLILSLSTLYMLS